MKRWVVFQTILHQRVPSSSQVWYYVQQITCFFGHLGVLLAMFLSERGHSGGGGGGGGKGSGGWIFLILFVKDYNVHGSYDFAAS